jgi:hypothetical protein
MMFAIGPCVFCQRVFSFNPLTVPSYRPAPGGAKEPICQGCMTKINANRAWVGRKPFPVAPDAYTATSE